MVSEGRSLAGTIIERYETRDVFEIAEKAGVQVVYGNWTPVTAGEFDWILSKIEQDDSYRG